MSEEKKYIWKMSDSRDSVPVRVELVNKTACFITYIEEKSWSGKPVKSRRRIPSPYEVFRDTPEECVEYWIGVAKLRVESAKDAIQYEKSKLGVLRSRLAVLRQEGESGTATETGDKE